ncbi:MAG TPA: MBL fold metallo-hydrolase [bacterium]|nr:MBL fold metallo-hydrolase [bacterium]
MANYDPKLYFVDVGHGNCSVLVDERGVVLVDAGPRNHAKLFLQKLGIKKVEVVLISHADEDHIAGLLALVACESFEIGSVALNPDSCKDTQLWNDLLYTLDKAHCEGKLKFQTSLTAYDLDTGRFDQGDVRIQIVAPSQYLAARGPGSKDRARRRIATNSTSAVVRLVKNGRPMAFLAGDIDQTGLTNLARSNRPTRAHILVFPHHGGLPGTTDPARFAAEVCRLVKPSVVVFSIGRGEHDTPNPTVVAAIRRNHRGVRIVCTQLSEHCARTVPTTDPPHTRDHHARGRAARGCCAGTIEVDLAHFPPHVKPDKATHREFIARAAPTALCTKRP